MGRPRLVVVVGLVVAIAVPVVSGAATPILEDGYTTDATYGVDASFPMHHALQPTAPGFELYQEFMRGCGAASSNRACENNEASRMSMNRDQPPRQRNYTSLGFGKLRAPRAAYDAARAFWDQHKDQPSEESWPPGNTYVNNWVAPTRMVSFEDRRFQPLGLRTKEKIWAGVKPVLEAWTGQRLKPTSLYGVRIYGDGAVLATHVDRLPLVTSAIIQIDQDVDEPWPVEVVGHDGVARNVTLEPGDMAMYESHTVLHGRPVPMRGRFFANVFVHFIPLDPAKPSENEPGVDFDWQKHARKKGQRAPTITDFPAPRPHAQALADAVEAAEASARPSAERRHSNDEPGHQVSPTSGEDFGQDAFATGTVTALHRAAATSDLAGVLLAVDRDPDAVNTKDENAWTALHESARAGHVGVVEALVNAGADLGARTISGSSALWIARRHQHTAVVEFLESLGAPEYADEL